MLLGSIGHSHLHLFSFFLQLNLNFRIDCLDWHWLHNRRFCLFSHWFVKYFNNSRSTHEGCYFIFKERLSDIGQRIHSFNSSLHVKKIYHIEHKHSWNIFTINLTIKLELDLKLKQIPSIVNISKYLFTAILDASTVVLIIAFFFILFYTLNIINTLTRHFFTYWKSYSLLSLIAVDLD